MRWAAIGAVTASLLWFICWVLDARFGRRLIPRLVRRGLGRNDLDGRLSANAPGIIGAMFSAPSADGLIGDSRPLADWARSLLSKKPFKLVAVALANKMARIGWAVMAKVSDYEPGFNGHKVVQTTA